MTAADFPLPTLVTMRDLRVIGQAMRERRDPRKIAGIGLAKDAAVDAALAAGFAAADAEMRADWTRDV